jgi:hypothetical protein
MRSPSDRPSLIKELATVADKLAAGKVSGEKRLELLRRQAQLGDLRDALAERSRRAQL